MSNTQYVCLGLGIGSSIYAIVVHPTDFTAGWTACALVAYFIDMVRGWKR